MMDSFIKDEKLAAKTKPCKVVFPYTKDNSNILGLGEL